MQGGRDELNCRGNPSLIVPKDCKNPTNSLNKRRINIPFHRKESEITEQTPRKINRQDHCGFSSTSIPVGGEPNLGRISSIGMAVCLFVALKGTAQQNFSQAIFFRKSCHVSFGFFNFQHVSLPNRRANS